MIKKDIDETREYIFPLGLPYVSAAMKLIGLNIITLNLNHYSDSIEQILRKIIAEHSIDVIMTGGLSADFLLVKDVVSTAKTINPELITIVGGGLISAEPEVAMEALEDADYGVLFEGELTASELALFLERSRTGFKRELGFSPDIKCLINGGDEIAQFHKYVKHQNNISDIEGIIYKSENSLVLTPKRQEITKLEILPWADYDGFGYEKFLNVRTQGMSSTETGQRLLSISSSRACPFKCTFCFHTTGDKYRQRSIADFIAEIKYMIDKYDINFIHIVDELFSAKIERVAEFCNALSPLGIPWGASFRVCDINEEMVAILQNSTCSYVALGIESFDNGILKSMHKNITVEQTVNALKLLSKKGVGISGAVIIGDIEETFESAQKSLDYIKSHPEFGIVGAFITPYPGTHDYQYSRSNNFIDDPIDYLYRGCPPINFSKMNDEEYIKIAKQVLNQKDHFSTLTDVKLVAENQEYPSYDFSGICPNCKTNSLYPNVVLFTNLQSMTCPKCKRLNFFMPPKELLNILASNITKLLEVFGKIVFWGGTNYFNKYINELDILQNQNILITDYSPCKWNTTYGTKTILPTSIIDDKKVDVVISTVDSYHTKIEATVKYCYPRVKQIFHISDLTDRDFCTKL